MTFHGADNSPPSNDPPRLRLHRVPRAHLVGIAGCGMRSLADVLDGSGWEVSGSDLQQDARLDKRFRVFQGHDAANLDESVELVVHSDAVPNDNPELRRAAQLRIETLSYPEMLGQLSEQHNTVAVAGTHGKSTTTALAGEILTAAGIDPTVIYGATPLGQHSGGRAGQSRRMVVEACEYRANFRHLKPEIAVILGIEPDHFDSYHSAAALENAFNFFARQVPSEGLVLARADCPATARVVQGISATCETFGTTAGALWQASELRERYGFYSFRLRCRQRLVCDVKLSVPGRHNVLNAVAAAAIASHSGASSAAIRQGLEQFGGLHRRLEVIASPHEWTIVDDYAHHPTEVRATLETLRQMYAGRRLWCVFQPHQASRTRHLLDEFAASLQNADKVIVADVYRAREPAAETSEVGASHLAAAARHLGADAIQLATAAEIRNHLNQQLRPHDVVVTMGAGDIGKLAHELGKGLRKFRQAG